MKFSPLLLAAVVAFSPINPLCAVEQGGSVAGVAPASDEGKNAIPSFQHDPGLKIELWAAEPMLANPVAFSQDEKGRWYVAETFRQEHGVEDNRGHKQWLDEDLASQTIADRLAYMKKHYADPAKFAERFTKFEDRIRRLEDTTGKGVADKSVIYADGFKDPLDGTGAGILARGNEVWWTSIPHLWRFRDADDDGAAEVKEKLLTGFGVKFAFRGHDMHGLRFGPDGKLYFSIGDRALNVATKEGPRVTETETGTIMRCNPDGTGFEIFATGVRNPQELAFDEHGNLFTGDNNSDSGDKARFAYLVEGGDTGWRMAYQYLPDRGPWNREKLWDEKEAGKARYLIPPIANIGNGPSGLTYNPGTGLGEFYRRQFFLSDFRGGATASVVHQIGLEPQGAFFKVKHVRDFVKGVLTTDVEFGNDGGLYVLDWVSSWGGVGKGRIYKFTDEKADVALQKETQQLIADGMVKRPITELAKLLGHADQRVRQAAQFELAARGRVIEFMDEIKSAVKTAAMDTKAVNPLSRLHAIWAFGQLSAGRIGLEDQALLTLLHDPDSEVRAQVANVLGKLTPIATAEKLIPLLQDKENRVRFFAALSLGKFAHQAAVEPLCKVLAENNDADPILRHGAVMGLAGCATAEQLAGKVNDPSPAVRGGVVVALRRQKSPLVAAFLKDADQSVVLEAARAIHDVPIPAALPALAAVTEQPAVQDRNIFSRAINARYRLGKLENAQALAALAANPSAPELARRDALEALAAWAHPDAKDRVLNQWRPLPDRTAADAIAAVTPTLEPLLTGAPAAIRETAARLSATLAIVSAGDPLFQLAADEGANTAARIEALRALAELKHPQLGQAAKVAVASKDAKLRAEGMQALAEADPAAAVQVIGQVIQRGSPREKQGAVLALAEIKSKEAETLLDGLLDALISGTLAPEVQLDVLEAAQQQPTPALKDKLALYEAAVAKGSDLAKWRVSLAGGNVERGRKIFREKAETQCLRCHRAEIGDSVVGPDMTHIGKTKDRAYLLESIVLPNKVIAEGFETVVLSLQNGDVTAGRLVGQDATALRIETMDEKGKPQVTAVPLAQIKERMGAPSPMPPNLGDFLSKTEMRDVIEYLATRK